MRKHCILFCVALISAVALKAQSGVESAHFQIRSQGFVENKGQVTDQAGNSNDSLLFLYVQEHFKLQLKSNGFSYELWEAIEGGEQVVSRADFYWMQMGQPKVEGTEALGGTENFYTTTERIHGVRSYQQVRYTNIYPGIDVLFELKPSTAEGGNTSPGIKYSYIVHPGANLDQLKLWTDGVSKVKAKRGQLHFDMGGNEVYENIPKSTHGNNEAIGVSYVLESGVVSFRTEIPHEGTLVIDPEFYHTRALGTYFGGKDEDEGYAVSTDDDLYVYVTGKTNSTSGIASTGAHQDTLGGSTDAFLAKFSSDLSKREWATYLGGKDEEIGYDVAIDPSDFIYVAGVTKSATNISTTGAHQTSPGATNSRDAFLAKFDDTGKLKWATYYGGSDEDIALSVACNKDLVVMAGSTKSTNGTSIATSSAHQSSHGGSSGYNDGFVVQFDTSGSRNWGTYYGGDEEDVATCVVLDQNGNTYMGGYTESDNGKIATSGAHQTGLGNRYDAFVVEFNKSGARQWATYYGGSKDDMAHGIDVKANGSEVYLTGETSSTKDIASTGAHQTTKGSGSDPDAFVVRFNGSGARQWGTYYGGSGEDIAYDIVYDRNENIVITGRTRSPNNIAVTNAYQTKHGGTGYYDCFLAKFKKDGVAYWTSYYGITLEDMAYGVTSDKDGFMVMTGFTRSTSGIATTGAYGTLQQGGNDVFIAKFCDLIITTDPVSQTAWMGSTVVFSIDHIGTDYGTYKYQWYKDSVAVSGATSKTLTIASADTIHEGTYYCEVSNDCNTSGVGSGAAKLTINRVSPDQSICEGSSASLQVADVSGATYKWSPSSGLNSTNTPKVTASPTATTTYQILISKSGKTDTAQIKVTVKPLPNVGAGNDTTVCAKDSFVIGTKNPGTSCSTCTYEWSPTAGLDNSTSSAPKLVLQNSGSTNQSFNYTLKTTLDGCSSSDGISITVKPAPSVNAGKDEKACAGGSPFVCGSPSPKGGTWSGFGITDKDDGIFSPLVSDTGTHCVYYTYTDGSSKCSNTDTLCIRVNPLPKVDAGRDTTICDQLEKCQLQGSPSGGTWTGPSALSTGGLFNGKTSGTGVYDAIYAYTNPTTGCSAKDTLVVTVVKPQKALAGNDTSFCYNGASVVLKGLPAGGGWTGTGIFAGKFFPDSAGLGKYQCVYQVGVGACASRDTVDFTVVAPPVINVSTDTSFCQSQSLVQLPLASPAGGSWFGKGVKDPSKAEANVDSMGLGTHYIKYQYTSGTTGCSNIDSVKVQVSAGPTVQGGADTTFCDIVSLVQLSGAPTGGVWKGHAELDSQGRFDPQKAGTGKYLFSYTYTDKATTCSATDTISVDVIKPTVALAGSDDSTCLNEGPIALKGSPMGGTWSGAGVLSGSFDPKVAGAGAHTLRYTIGAGSCANSDSITMKVHTPLAISAGRDTQLCVYNDVLELKGGASHSTGWFLGAGITDSLKGSFSPAAAGVGSHLIRYRVPDPVTGCMSEDTLQVQVNGVPRASLAIDSIQCQNTHALYPLGIKDSLVWDFGNGQVRYGDSIRYAYPDTGRYTLQVELVSGAGCSDTLYKNIEVIALPQVSFKLDTNEGCAPVQVRIQNQSQAKYGTQQWAFGDGSSYTGAAPGTRVFTGSPYTATWVSVQLEVSNTCATVRQVDSIKVKPIPKAQVYLNPQVGCSPLTVSIRNRSIGVPDALTWSFGDGTVGTSKDSIQTRTFFADTTVKYYTIALSITNECGTDTDSTELKVKPNTLKAFHTSSVIEGCVPMETQLIDYHVGGATVSWRMSDGQVYGNQDTVLHTFVTEGTHSIEQYVTDGCSHDTFVSRVTVYPAPELDFEIEKASVLCEQQEVQLRLLSDNISEVNWNLGDGSFATGTSIRHEYDTSGVFTVELSGKDNSAFQCVGKVQKEVEVKPNPDLSIEAQELNGCPEFRFSVSNTSSNAVGWLWDFDDQGATSTNEEPGHVYRSPGRYRAQAVATSNWGCKDSQFFDIWVFDVPEAKMAVSDSFSCGEPLEVRFSDAVGADDVQRRWIAGTDTLQQLELKRFYDQVGKYPVQLEVRNEFGCVSTDAFTFEYRNAPQIVMDTAVNPCQKEVVFDLQNSQFVKEWSFQSPGGKTRLLSDSMFTWYFADTGHQEILLKATTRKGCSTELSYSVYVPSPERFIYVPNAFSPNGDGLNDVFGITGYNHQCYGPTELKVFNRWGELVYAVTGMNPTWDGQIEKQPNRSNLGKMVGNYESDNVFVYVFTNSLFAVKGNVTVLKPNGD